MNFHPSIPKKIKDHGLKGYPTACDWSKNDLNRIALGSETGEICIYDLRMIALEKPFCVSKPHNRLVRKVKFRPNSSHLIASASEDSTTKSFSIIIPSVLNEASLSEM
jgi:WD40 repeat protein